MSIAALIRSMASAGATPEAIAIAVDAIEAAQNAVAEQRAAAALRKRRQRERQRDCPVTVTGQSQDIPGQTPAPSPPSPFSPQTPLKPQPPHPHPRDTALARKGTRLPNDFEIPADWLEWAQAERGWCRTDAESEAGSFHDHWIAKPGKDGLKLDWQATWRNWVRGSRRNGRNGSGNRNGSTGGRPSAWAPRFEGAGFEPASLDD